MATIDSKTMDQVWKIVSKHVDKAKEEFRLSQKGKRQYNVPAPRNPGKFVELWVMQEICEEKVLALQAVESEISRLKAEAKSGDQLGNFIKEKFPDVYEASGGDVPSDELAMALMESLIPSEKPAQKGKKGGRS
jgi:hypothetical protein